MQCLGLDIGSSSIKGAVLDLARGQAASIVREPFPDPVPGLPPRHFEVDPAEIVARVESVLRRLAEAAPEAEAVFSCGQMGGVVLVDPRGEAQTNYLSWRDQRTLGAYPAGGNFLEEISRRWTAEEFADLGSELKPGSATSLLFWLAENGRLPRDAIPASAGDFLLGQLCRAEPRMDPTQAIGLLNLRTGDWHRDAFAALGIDRLLWRPPAAWNVPVGEVELGGRKLPCYPTLGDQQCALWGARLEEDELSLNVSTGSQVSRLTREFRPGNYQTRRFVDGRHLNTITHLPAGRSLNALVDLLTELPKAEGAAFSNVWSHIASAAAAAAGGGLECNLAFFAGPLGDTGSLSGITVDNLTVGNLFRAAFCAMAENYRLCADRLDPSHSWKRVALSGGLTQSIPILRELISRQFAAPIRESCETEETLAGLLSIAREVLARGRSRQLRQA